MDTRREFLKKAMLFSGAATFHGIPESIRKAMTIDPASGSTYLDAEHVVILMQENRSFDHCFGTLRGVRGFNDPRAVRLPNNNPVWLQTNEKNETYAPFRFDIHDTKITWMGSIPHVRSSQVDAFNKGNYDQWLIAKRSGNPQYRHMPLTMGYYTREDLPFNYALADAFTVCDQNFSSGMTSTWPNRLFLWTGTIRGRQDDTTKAYIRNDVQTGEINWTTFPELLEQAGVPWRVYQNDLTLGGGFSGEERAWLANFGCNLLEPFDQFNCRFSLRYTQSLKERISTLTTAIAGLRAKAAALSPGDNNAEKIQKEIDKKQALLADAQKLQERFTPENFAKLTQKEKDLYQKAFTINDGDPDYHRLEPMSYEDNGTQRQLNIPKGDILHQFRQDVDNGKLPAVSWLVGPENFSDHPTAPWYGAWYVSEILDILTKNPEVWKKTIFILTYDENDGYFDHIPPFVAPDAQDPTTGKCSQGIDTTAEYIRREHELQEGVAPKEARTAPAGLGFRVPMVIASPWSRGGRVCSQVFDHTSVFRFVQSWLNKKHNAGIHETNTSLWRRTVSGDLTSVFQPYNGEPPTQLPWLKPQPFIEGIYSARFREAPGNYKALSADEIAAINKDHRLLPARQEPGIVPSCALPYQLYAAGNLSADGKTFTIRMEARNEVFGERAAGSPFNIHSPERLFRSYAVAAGAILVDSFPVDGDYDLAVHGPNGFFRQYKGNARAPHLLVHCDYERAAAKRTGLTGRLVLIIMNPGRQTRDITITDHAYGNKPIQRSVAANAEIRVIIGTASSHGWYDLGITNKNSETFEQRYSGRVETGKDSFTDPFMGRTM
ncbi:MAG TPA: phospholipase C, phosphocholine-specific [Puia sp.]|jgi:phospholipase C